MKLTQTHQLDDTQHHDLVLLCQQCRNVDGHSIPTYPKLLAQYRQRPSNILCYDKTQLIGFLSAFFFFDNGCEITLMVAPTYRKQGIARALMNHIFLLLKAERLDTIVVSSPMAHHTTWFPKLGFEYLHSEYLMERKIHTLIENKASFIHLRAATLDDIPCLCAINYACFSETNSDIITRIHHVLLDPTYDLFIAELDGIPIGKVHLSHQANQTLMSDIAILPSHQKHGFGHAMLALCINHCLSNHHPNLVLEVETSNEHALKLYFGLGFTIANAYDFWSIPLDKLALQ